MPSRNFYFKMGRKSVDFALHMNAEPEPFNHVEVNDNRSQKI